MKGNWFIDKKTICEKMCISTRYFEIHFMKDARLKSCEYRRGRMVLWETDKAKKYVKDILNEIAE
ncbi:hypothetical protein AALF85_02485 [Jeotgalicoccus halotolerans]|uniref:hypothetical protein n=1 Tax=Jeotgalicoccus halotolerans TaxID=157227 RepID=UPI003515DAD4